MGHHHYLSADDIVTPLCTINITLRFKFGDQLYNNVISSPKEVRSMKDVMKSIILVKTIAF